MEGSRLCYDMINSLPAAVLENILCLVPIQEAARTSILSRDWRYHWTKIPRLVFILNKVKISNKDDLKERLSKLFYAINQVMSMCQGPIQEFLVFMPVDGRCIEMDRIIDHLSRNNHNNNNTVKTLVLSMSGYWLPQSLFSLHKLTDLYLHHCYLGGRRTFNGFPSLAKLYMQNAVITTKKMLLLFLSSCPLLKIVILDASFGPRAAGDNTTLVELLECLPLIERLSISHSTMTCFCQGKVPKKLPTALVHLKCLCIRESPFFYEDRIACLAFLLRSSPNLEKLKLKFWSDLRVETTCEDYSDLLLERLNELEIVNWRRSDQLELEFLKVMMAKSPVLKRLRILLDPKASRDQELRISRTLLQFRCASPVVQIIVERGLK